MKAPPDSGSRIPELDGVRGIAILSVLYWHYFASQRHEGTAPVVRALERAGMLSWAGVDLFFVLSGFLIGGILLEHRDSPRLLRAFYARRMLRIVPIYYAWILAYLAVRALAADRLHSPWLLSFPLPIASYLSFTQNFWIALDRAWGPHWLSPTWSLSVEEQFYVVLPWVVVLLRPSRLLALSVALVVTAPLVRYYFLARGNDLAALVLLPARWDALFLGVIGAHLYRSHPQLCSHPSGVRILHACLLGLFAATAAWIAWPPEPHGWLPALQATLLSALSLLFIAFALYSPWRGFLANRWLAGLGVISYGVYMIHEGIYGLLYALTHEGTLRTGEPATSSWLDLDVMLLSLAVSLSIAAVSYRYFEGPLLRLGRRFAYR